MPYRITAKNTEYDTTPYKKMSRRFMWIPPDRPDAGCIPIRTLVSPLSM
jgi:hypothetical protein